MNKNLTLWIDELGPDDLGRLRRHFAVVDGRRIHDTSGNTGLNSPSSDRGSSKRHPARATLKEMGATKIVEALRFQYSADAKLTRVANDFLHDVESTTIVIRNKTTGKAIANVNEFKLPELEQNVRLFLCAGGVLTKHCKRAAPRKRQVFVSTDLRFLVWKEPNKKPRSFFLDNCDKIVSGRSSPELLRESMLFTSASENLSFSVFMKDGRRLSVEAPTEQLRDQWVRCLESLIRYRQALAKLTLKEENNRDDELEKEDIFD